MEEMKIELEELKDQLNILKETLKDEEVVSDDMVRQAMQSYVDHTKGSRKIRIIMFVIPWVLIFAAVWLSYQSVKALIITSIICVISGFVNYLYGEFSRVDDIADEMTLADFEEVRAKMKIRDTLWGKFKIYVGGFIAFFLIYAILRYPDVASGNTTIGHILFVSVLWTIIMSIIFSFYIKKRKKDYLNLLDDTENMMKRDSR